MLITNSHYHEEEQETDLNIEGLKQQLAQPCLYCVSLSPFLDELEQLYQEYRTVCDDRTKYFFFYKQEILKEELLQKYWELASDGLGAVSQLLALSLQTSRKEFDNEGLQFRSQIAEIEFHLNRRLLDLKPAEQSHLKNLWTAAEQLQILHQRINQNEVRVNFVLLPQIDRITLELNQLNKDYSSQLVKIADQSQEEEKLMSLIESLNYSRRQQLIKLVDSEQLRAIEEIKKIVATHQAENDIFNLEDQPNGVKNKVLPSNLVNDLLNLLTETTSLRARCARSLAILDATAQSLQLQSKQVKTLVQEYSTIIQEMKSELSYLTRSWESISSSEERITKAIQVPEEKQNGYSPFRPTDSVIEIDYLRQLAHQARLHTVVVDEPPEFVEYMTILKEGDQRATTVGEDKTTKSAARDITFPSESGISRLSHDDEPWKGGEYEEFDLENEYTFSHRRSNLMPHNNLRMNKSALSETSPGAHPRLFPDVQLYSYEEQSEGMFWIDPQLPEQDRFFLAKVKELTKPRHVYSRLFKKELHTSSKFNPFCINLSLSVNYGYQPTSINLNSASYTLELHSVGSGTTGPRTISIDIFDLRKVLVSQETKQLKKPVPSGFIYELSLMMFSKKRYDLLVGGKEDFAKLKSGLEAVITLKDVLNKYKPQDKSKHN